MTDTTPIPTPSLQVLCLGEILFDSISDELGVSIDQVQTWTHYPGGAPANVACALSKLGSSAGFIGAIGQDGMGAALLEVLRSNQVSIAGVQLIPATPTRSVFVTRNAAGDRTFAGFANQRSSESFADTQLNADQLPVELIQSAQYLVTGTLLLAYPKSEAAVRRTLELAKAAGVNCVIDLNWRPVFWADEAIAKSKILDIIPQADYLKLTDEESQWLFGHEDVRKIRSKFPQLKAILMTKGAKGCRYWMAVREQGVVSDAIGEVPAFKVDVEDTTGAGDSFLAGFLHQLCLQDPDYVSPDVIRSIITYASATGALTTVKRGAIAASPTAAEVVAFLHLETLKARRSGQA